MIRPIYPDPGPPIADLGEHLMKASRVGDGRPWIMVNMVSSIDGGTALEGGATALTDDDDQRLFAAFRGVADVILVGAATVRAENYGPPRLSDEVQQRRIESGQDRLPRIAVLTKQLDFGTDARLFSDPENPPLIFAGTGASSEAVARVSESAEVIVGSGPTVDPDFVVKHLADSGVGVILCEGGPTVNGQFLAADVVDEFNISRAPVAIAGPSARLSHSPAEIDPALEFRLDQILLGDRMLFLRYLRTQGDGGMELR